MAFTGFKGADAMNDPDMILSVSGNADALAEDPVVGQWFRPERIHFEAGRHNARCVHHGARLKDSQPACKNNGGGDR